MRKTWIVGAVLGICLLISISTVKADDLFEEGSFEGLTGYVNYNLGNTTFAPWYMTYGGAQSEFLGNITEIDANDGSKSLHISGSSELGAQVALYTLNSLRFNSTINFMVKGSITGSGIFYVTAYNSSEGFPGWGVGVDIALQNITYDSWTKISFNLDDYLINTTEGMLYFDFECPDGGSFDLFIDDITTSYGIEGSYEYKYYAVVENCYASSDGYASASCSLEIPIPDDCINIKTKATTIIDWDQTAYNIVNDTFGFTRLTCNPDTGDYGACDNDFNECSYLNFNTPNTITYYNYEGGQTAKAWFLLATGGTCISDGLGTPAPYNITGQYIMEAECLTSSGIVLPNGTATGCEKIKTCYNSNTMLIVDENCLSTYISCPYGCENGVCLPTTTTTLKNEDSLIPLDEDDLGGAGGLISVIFTPFFIGFMFLFGIASILEYQTRSKGAVFTLTVLGGSLALGFVGIFPLWLAILLACLSGGVFAFLIRKGIGGG